MPYLTISIRVTSDAGGEPAVVFDHLHRVSMTESQILAVTKSGGDVAGVYTTIPTVNKIPALNAIIIATDQPINLKMASVAPADGVIALNAGGIFLALDANIASGASTNALINNVGASTANLSGLVGGS